MKDSKQLLEKVNFEIIDDKTLKDTNGGGIDWSKFWNETTCITSHIGKRAGASTGTGGTC